MGVKELNKKYPFSLEDLEPLLSFLPITPRPPPPGNPAGAEFLCPKILIILPVSRIILLLLFKIKLMKLFLFSTTPSTNHQLSAPASTALLALSTHSALPSEIQQRACP